MNVKSSQLCDSHDRHHRDQRVCDSKPDGSKTPRKLAPALTAGLAPSLCPVLSTEPPQPCLRPLFHDVISSKSTVYTCTTHTSTIRKSPRERTGRLVTCVDPVVEVIPRLEDSDSPRQTSSWSVQSVIDSSRYSRNSDTMSPIEPSSKLCQVVLGND